ncbi:MAG: A/G-specific adenine glycosylase, partial [Bacteroidetes bacterium]
ERFPTVQALATASEDEVLKLWEGLGYYSRARNLLEAARTIVREHGGRFPRSYEGLLTLKGVGPYTAAAIASFAYGLPHAVLDGNVFRVLARFCGVDLPIDSSRGKKHFQQLADAFLDPADPGAYNQTLMNFGATWCTPQNPRCRQCPLAPRCKAHQEGSVLQLPRKSKSAPKRQRHFHYLVFHDDGALWVGKRTDRDIWKHLHEFPLIESPRPLTRPALQALPAFRHILGGQPARFLQKAGPLRHVLSHQLLLLNFWEWEVQEGFVPKGPYRKVSVETAGGLAFPRPLQRFLQRKSW